MLQNKGMKKTLQMTKIILNDTLYKYFWKYKQIINY